MGRARNETVIPLKQRIVVAADMHGCPNRCRHCYLGQAALTTLSAARLREVAALFRGWRRPGEDGPFFCGCKFSTWAREPDYGANYRDLYALESELSDGAPARYELLSVWRLARDASYGPWARSIGTQKCQISFFGVGRTQDWFHRRSGAFADSLTATERLLDAGIMPRWQLFVTRKLLPDAEQLLALAKQMRIRERCEAIGTPWEVFCHVPGADGEARKIEWLRPTLEEIAGMPHELLQVSRRHRGRDELWHTEEDLIRLIEGSEVEYPYAYRKPPITGFYLLPSGDVYSNWGTFEPWWRLGNLGREGLGVILQRYERAEPLAMRTIHSLPPTELVRRYGDASGQRLYSSASDLLGLYLARYCEQRRAATATRGGSDR